MAIKKWYVLHTYSQHEDKVKESIESIAVNNVENGLSDLIGEVFLPKRLIKEIDKNGKAREKYKIVYPGYLYVNLCLTNDVWHIIRGVDGVTGFLGQRPTPVRQKEIDAIKASLIDKEPVRITAWKKGDQVQIISGSFDGSEGVVDTVYDNKVKVMVEFFNKLTPVEVNFEDIEKI